MFHVERNQQGSKMSKLLTFGDVTVADIIYALDNEEPRWREYVSGFEKVIESDIGIRADLALVFLKSHMEWLDDIVPPIIDPTGGRPSKYHPLEWVVQVMDNARAADVLEDTANQVWNYIRKKAFVWLLEEEESAIGKWV